MSDEPVLQQKTPLDTLCLYLTKKLAYGRKTFSLLVAFISWSDKKLASFFSFFFFLIAISTINAYFSSLITKVSFLYRVRGRKTNHAITTIFHGLINLFHDSAIFACALALMDKSNVTWFLRGANWSRLFVLSKRDDDFILEKRTVRVSDNFTSVLLAVRTYWRYCFQTRNNDHSHS